MKLYLMASPSHSALLQDWCLPSLKEHHQDRMEVQVRYVPQLCASAVYKTRGWTAAVLEKVSFIESAVAENWGSEFLYSDVDVQFLGDVLPVLENLPLTTDLFFQRDSPDGMLCSGFFLCRANGRTAAFWKKVGDRLRMGHSTGDQDAVNSLLRGNKTLAGTLTDLFRPLVTIGPTYDYLPNSFFGGGTATGRLWNLGDSFPIPPTALVHHANWTEGISNKLAQLAWVSRTFDCRSAPLRATIGACSTERGSDSIA